MLRALRSSVILALVAPATVLAAGGGDAVIKDCTTNGQITQHHSQRDYRTALANLPADIAEYSNCAELIRQALLSDANRRGGGGGGGTGGGIGGSRVTASQPPPTQSERRQIISAKKGGSAPVRVGGLTLTPGASAFGGPRAGQSLPAPLILLLVMLALPTLLGVSLAVRRLVISRRTP